jgi:hypothetical protein
MLENFLPDHATIERLRGGLFSPHLDSFIATLAQSGSTGGASGPVREITPCLGTTDLEVHDALGQGG